ncbi:hypothetical protein B0H21DRAFT_741134 [Amylocystis lapponica]|nr:hypothetical protein B0H21DRAFT_741134 [Amylocystis lapponica]
MAFRQTSGVGAYNLYVAASQPKYKIDMELTFILIQMHQCHSLPLHKLEAGVTRASSKDQWCSAWVPHEGREEIILGRMLLGIVEERDLDALRELITSQQHINHVTTVVARRPPWIPGPQFIDQEWVESVLRDLVSADLLSFEARPFPDVDQVVPVLQSFAYEVLRGQHSSKPAQQMPWGYESPIVACPATYAPARTHQSTPYPGKKQ